MIRALVADDQEVVRAGFSALLDTQPDITVVASAADGAEAVQLSTEHRPDVVLMDVRMPVMDGIEATRQICAGDDGDGPRILILTTFDLDEYVYDALHSGASGFLLKDVPAETLFEAVRVIAAGEALLAPAITRRLIAEFARLRPRQQTRPDGLAVLTPRETEILRTGRRRAVESRNRRPAGAERRDRQDPRQPRPAQARAARPRAGGRDRVRIGLGGPPRLVLEERASGVVSRGVARLPEPLDEAPEDVADPDHPEQVIALDDRQMPDLPLSHQPGSVEDGHTDIDSERIARHHIPDPDRLEIRAVTREGEHVPLGEDADELAGVADRDRADAFLEHSQDGNPRGVVGVHRHHPRPHDVSDRHALCGV